jgi:hypothetical protein
LKNGLPVWHKRGDLTPVAVRNVTACSAGHASLPESWPNGGRWRQMACGYRQDAYGVATGLLKRTGGVGFGNMLDGIESALGEHRLTWALLLLSTPIRFKRLQIVISNVSVSTAYFQV